MNTCIYLRKSRADAEAEIRGEGETLARHEKILLEVAKKQKLSIEKIYKEIVSGETIASRPVMQQLLSEVEQGMWDSVLVVEVERLARGDTIDQGIMSQTFKYSGTKIITPLKMYDPNNEQDEEYFEFGLFMSRREYKTINRRLQKGRELSVKEGKFVGNITPYGYTKEKIKNNKGYTLTPHPDEAPIVKLIYDLYTIGESLPNGLNRRLGVSKIVNKLNKLKLPARKGVWTVPSVRDILINPVYIGKIRWNNRKTVKKIVDGKLKKTRPRSKDVLIAQGLHEPLINENTYTMAQDYISINPSRPTPSEMELTNPIAGLVVCDLCGRKMVRRPYNLHNKPASLICNQTSCTNVSSHLHYVEEAIIKALISYAESLNTESKKQKQKTHIDINTSKKALEKMEIEMSNSKKQLDNIHDLLEQEIYSIDMFLDRTKTINEKIKILKNDINILSNEIKKVEEKQNEKVNLLPKIKQAIEMYNKSTSPGEKNDILKQVLDKVTYLKTVKNNKISNPANFKITIFPKLLK